MITVDDICKLFTDNFAKAYIAHETGGMPDTTECFIPSEVTDDTNLSFFFTYGELKDCKVISLDIDDNSLVIWI